MTNTWERSCSETGSTPGFTDGTVDSPHHAAVDLHVFQKAPWLPCSVSLAAVSYTTAYKQLM